MNTKALKEESPIHNPEETALAERTIYSVLFALSLSHMLNDTLQSIIPAIYPLIKGPFKLSFLQIGIITLVYQMTASILQPFIGMYTDKKPHPYSLVAGMILTLSGLLVLSVANTYTLLLISVGMVGMGSSIFHPEASRIAYLASGKRHGLAQSIFQLGGNAGGSLGPLLAALIITPYGREYIGWFSILALFAMVIMFWAGKWYKKNIIRKKNVRSHATTQIIFSRNKVRFALFILLVLIFSKYFYMASMTSYFTFYLKDKFLVSDQVSQLYLFLFLFSVALGTMIGGPLGDKIGRKYVIWISILGVAPFSLLLPHANLFWTAILACLIGVIIASAFSAILIYAQELMPGKVGMVAGLFFGLAFGMGGIGSAVLGKLADVTSIEYVYQVCAYLPLIGLFTGLLPTIEKRN